MTKKIRLIFLVVGTSVFLSACGKDSSNNSGGAAPAGGPNKPINKAEYPNVEGSIFGKWQIEQPERENGFTITTQIFLNDKGSLSVSVECAASETEKVSTTLSTSIKVDATSVEILEDAKSEAKGKFKDQEVTCTASVSKTKFNYRVQADSLLLFGGGQAQLRFSRMR